MAALLWRDLKHMTDAHRTIGMSEEQAMDREERVAIMVHCGGVTERQAQEYCNSKQEIYGYVKQELT